jgi:hypothetical protein
MIIADDDGQRQKRHTRHDPPKLVPLYNPNMSFAFIPAAAAARLTLQVAQ